MIKTVGLTNRVDMLPLGAVNALKGADTVVLQTKKTPVYEEIQQICKNIITLDYLYEEATDFDELYVLGAKVVIDAQEQGEVVFAAVDSNIQNGFLQEIEKETDICFLNAGNCVEDMLCMARKYLGDIVEYRVFHARNIENLNIDTSVALVVRGIDDIYTAGVVKLALSEQYGENTQAVFVCDGKVSKENLYDLDRVKEFGTGITVLIAPVALTKNERFSYADLIKILQRLRGKDGCPWDREQTHKTLRQYLIEEAYEVAEAVDADDMNALYDELGDVLMQVVFHGEIARQCGEFNDIDITTAVCKKMILRHPHVFSDTVADTADEVVFNWEKIKRKEKGNDSFLSVLKDIPKALGAVQRAYKLQKKAAVIGFDWENAEQAFEKVLEETEELRQEMLKGDQEKFEQEAGDLLFAFINVLRKSKVDPEIALNRTCEKFIRRFEYMEENSDVDLSCLSLEELDGLWEGAKNQSL